MCVEFLKTVVSKPKVEKMDPGVGVIGGGGPNSWAIPDDNDEVEMMHNKEVEEVVEEMENGEDKEENAAKLPKRTKGKTLLHVYRHPIIGSIQDGYLAVSFNVINVVEFAHESRE